LIKFIIIVLALAYDSIAAIYGDVSCSSLAKVYELLEQSVFYLAGSFSTIALKQPIYKKFFLEPRYRFGPHG
jgi:hypothetical protein